jgi:hypothetical protein
MGTEATRLNSMVMVGKDSVLVREARRKYLLKMVVVLKTMDF